MMGPLHARNVRLALVALTIVVIYGVVMLLKTQGHVAGRWTQSALSWELPVGDSQPRHTAANIASVGDLDGDTDVGRVGNRTLGFEKVFAIGLRERTDKRDAMTLMAALSGFDIDWIDGVKPGQIPDKAVPFGIDVSAVHDNFLGSWRGHMDAIRYVVETGISTALIMEDDMDWDVHVKSQLADLAHGAQYLFPDSKTRPNSPYGDDWDLLWLGHCGEPFPEFLEENLGINADGKAKISKKYAILDDDTVPPYSQLSGLVDWAPFQPRTRVVHITAAPICSFSYAVSQRGARKLLHALSVDGLRMAFDNSLAQLCRDAVFELGHDRGGGYGMKCVSVNPTLMFHHKAKGLVAADSDIQTYGENGGVRDKGTTESIQWSMRQNLMNLLTDRPLEMQFRE